LKRNYFKLRNVCFIVARRVTSVAILSWNGIFGVFGQHVKYMQESSLFCRNNDCRLNNNAQNWRLDYYIERDSNNNVCCRFQNDKCFSCGENLEIRFIHNPPWILVESEMQSDIVFTELPTEIEIGGRKFTLLCSTISSQTTNAHFQAIFALEKKFFLVDDLKQSAVEHVPPKSKTSYSFYFFSQ